jgi:hypothetical protein
VRNDVVAKIRALKGGGDAPVRCVLLRKERLEVMLIFQDFVGIKTEQATGFQTSGNEALLFVV